jgi:hypothetical protein
MQVISKEEPPITAAQQSMHWTLGIPRHLRQAFFWFPEKSHSPSSEMGLTGFIMARVKQNL